MPISTGVINLIDIELFKDGFLVKYPSIDKPDEIASRGKQSLKQISAMDEYDELFKFLNTKFAVVTAVESVESETFHSYLSGFEPYTKS